MSGTVDAARQAAVRLLQQARYAAASDAYAELLRIDPQRPDDWYNLGYCLRQIGRFEAALQAYGEALARGVQGPEEVHLNRAVIYSDGLRRDKAAAEELEQALRLAPNYVPALLNLGNLHEEQGERALAIDCYRRILAQDPEPSSQAGLDALARLAHLLPPDSVADPRLAQMASAAGRSGFEPLSRAGLWLALGRVLDQLGEHPSAFSAWQQGNALNRQLGPGYDRRRQTAITDALIAAAADTDERLQAPDKGPRPLFICGLFRSGSTLLEQALAMHPGLVPGGELEFFPRLVAGELSPFPQSLQALGTERLEAIARRYREELVRLFPAAGSDQWISDKRPDNFLLIGLLLRLFPDARIIHSRRDLLDTGLSIYMQHLSPAAMPYANDLADIGHYIGEYLRLMAHWQRLWPDRILDFDYDAFVREPEARLRPVLQFLGLPWEPRCLAFHKQRNTVKTASYWQVRQPLYQSASGRWRHYREQLRPLMAALAQAGVSGADWPE